ncbi:MAG: MFS transporter [Methyloligellaceae bacterium]
MNDTTGGMETQAGDPEAQPIAHGRKWTAVTLLVLCCVLALSVWFAGTAIQPLLAAHYAVSPALAGLGTASVGLGFVAGTLTSAVLGLADRPDPRRFFMICCFVASAANAATAFLDPGGWAPIALRFCVGATMAGVYPVGMKMVSSWATNDRGLLVGLLAGAVTLGSAMPHLVAVFTPSDWRETLLASSALVIVAGVLVNFVALGPGHGQAAKFRARYVLKAWTSVPMRLANFGYFGHMWELYAMWGWVGAFLAASFAVNPGSAGAAVWAKLATFAAVAIGALGCLLGGLLADRIGRTVLTSGAMAVSGACALLVGFLFGASPWLLTLVCLIWGLAAVADSAQFSASVIELSEPELVGTMLTVQTCIGFLITFVTIQATPYLVEIVGWRYGFAYLALGPALGIAAMLRLGASPAARRLAGGRG